MARVIFYFVLILGNTSAFAELKVINQRTLKSVVGSKLSYPRDHGAHSQYAIEWWYFTGHLFDSSGRKSFGAQFTVFRIAHLSPALSSELRDLYVVHIGLSDLAKKTFDHMSFSLPDDAIAVSKTDLEIVGPGFSVKRKADNHINLNWQAVLPKQDGLVSFTASLQSETDLVLHGEQGVSFKSTCSGCATVYSSFPRLRGEVELQTPRGTRTFKGLFWYDHEYGSNVLDENQVGWDWFGINFNDGEYLKFFQLRDDSQAAVFSSATIGKIGGSAEKVESGKIKLKPLRYWTSKKTGVRYPIAWQLEHPSRGELVITSELEDQEIISSHLGFPNYYEGNCRVERNGEVIGHAYLEMNGYGDSSTIPKF